MDNSVDGLMNGWNSGNNPDSLFSDQTADDNAFTFEEPDIGLDEMVLDRGESGVKQMSGVPEDNRTTAINDQLKSEGHPGIFKIETSELERLANENRGIEIGNELDSMLSLIAEYGVVHGLGLFYAENNKFIEEDYAEEESPR